MTATVLAALLAGTALVGAVPEGTATPPIVASVRLEADGEEAARLGRYVEVKAGSPLDPEVVRHVVELLYATGEFADVVVETAPATGGGVDVVFRPIKAPLLSEVRVTGDAVLKPDAVRRTTRLRGREPLWTNRLDQAARDVALSLAHLGYLEARVTAVAEVVPTGADAVFTITAGPLVRVGAARLEGPAEAIGALRSRIRPQPGEAFRRDRAQAAAQRMRDALVGRGHWRAAVTVEEAFDPGAGLMTLVFRAEPGPLVDVEVRGGEARMRGRVRDLLRDGGLKSDAVEEASDLLEEEARRQGHRLAQVSHHEQQREGRLLIVYEVEPGPQARVASVRVEGDETEGLSRIVQTRAGEPLLERRVAEDTRALTRAVEDRGHPGARVDAEVPEGGGDLPVLFRVHAGPRTHVSSLRVETPQPLPPDAAPQELRLREGGPYRLADLARDRDTVLSAYRNAGYMQAEVAPEVSFSEDRAQAAVVLRVAPGPPTTVEHVVIAGLETTKEAVVRRELAVKEGEPLGLDRVLETQRRLGALGLFDRVTITEMDPESPLQRSVVVRAEEAPLTSVSYGLGYAEREKLRGSAEVTRRNLFGMDRRLTVFARASLQPSFRLLTTFREPYFLSRKQELFVTAFREEEDRDAFDFTRTGLTLQTARTLSRSWSLILRETYEETRTFNTSEDCLRFGREFCPGTLSGPSASLVHDTRDDPLDPRRGHFLLADSLVSHRWLGGNTLVKGFVQGATYQLLTARTLVAVSARLGLARTFGEEQLLVPKPDRFFAGGDYSMRGFGVDDVRPDGGNALILGGLELRRHLAGAFWGAAFAETGNVYALVSNMSLGDLRYTAGLGLRYKSAVGPLRFDWGYKLDPRPGEKRYHFHFTIGHAF